MNAATAEAIYDAVVPGWRDAPLRKKERRVRAPYRDDKNPSLDIHEEKLTWTDRSTGEGGGAVDLARRVRGEEGARSLFRELGDKGGAQSAPIVATYDYHDAAGELVYQVVRKEPKAFLQRRPNGTGGWIWKLGDVEPTIYRLPAVLAAVAAEDPIWIVEGEKDADAIWDAENVGTCNSGGAGKWRGSLSVHFKDARDVRIVADNDEPGHKHALGVARSITAVGGTVTLLHSPVGKDVSDLIAAGRGLEDLEPLDTGEEVSRVSAEEQRDTPGAGDDPDVAGIDPKPEDSTAEAAIITRVADVKPEKVGWLWQGRIPQGKVTVLDGDPGLGKSTASLDVAARVTTGRAMPDGTPGVSGGVVILSAEDDIACTIRPRLEAAGADINRVVVFEAVRTDHGDRLPELPQDLERTEKAAVAIDAALIIIDPLMAFLSGTVNAHHDQDVRRALAPMAKMAERTGAAVLVIRHLNKAPGGNVIYRGGGSIGIIGAARSGLLIAQDPDDPDRRVLAVTKANLAAMPPALGFRLVPVESGTVEVDWLGTNDHTAASLLSMPADEGERSALDEARGWLRDLLTKAERQAKDVMIEAKRAGIAEKTLQRAKTALGVRAQKSGFGGGWVWIRPPSYPAKVVKPPATPSWTTFAEVDHLRGGRVGTHPEDSQKREEDGLPQQKSVGNYPEDGQEREGGQAGGIGKVDHLRGEPEDLDEVLL